MKRQIISFPHMGNYHVPIRAFLQRLYPQAQVRLAPPISKKTAVCGARHSPDYICEPFKYNVGNFIEALDAGANILFQTGLGCRFAYYGEVQEQILRDLGYEFDFLCLSRTRIAPPVLYQTLKSGGSPLNATQMSYALCLALTSIRQLDMLEEKIRQKKGQSKSPKEIERIHGEFLRHLENAESVPQMWSLGKHYGKQIENLPSYKNARPLNIGIVGDLYTVMEPFSNGDVEAKLFAHGARVHRVMSLSFLLFGPSSKRATRQTKGYLKHPIGANGQDSVAQSLHYAQRGYDGILHLKSFGCTPELNAQPTLAQISKEYNIPILHLSYDTHQSKTGLESRLEAFLDMLEMKRRAQDGKNLQPRGGHRLHFHQSGGLRP